MSAHSTQLDLDHDASAPRTARTFAFRALSGWGVADDVIERTQLLVSELVSNAVLHGSAPVHMVVCQLGDRRTIRIEVCNGGEGRPIMRSTAPNDVSGRGLQLIGELADEWGAEVHDGQTMVWIEFELPDA